MTPPVVIQRKFLYSCFLLYLVNLTSGGLRNPMVPQWILQRPGDMNLLGHPVTIDQ